MTDTITIRKLAEAATPGEWVFGTFHRLLVVPVINGHPYKHTPIADMGAGEIPWDKTDHSRMTYNNAEYIAAANPTAIIALLDEIDSLRAAQQAEQVPDPMTLMTDQSIMEAALGWREFDAPGCGNSVVYGACRAVLNKYRDLLAAAPREGV